MTLYFPDLLDIPDFLLDVPDFLLDIPDFLLDAIKLSNRKSGLSSEN